MEVNISNPDFFKIDKQLEVAIGDYHWCGTLGPWFAKLTEEERNLTAPVDLASLPRPTTSRVSLVHGLPVPDRFQTFVFGPGGTGKSLLLLKLAGELAKAGKRTLWLDWEMDKEEHTARLWDIYGENRPAGIYYESMDAPLPQAAENVRNMVDEYGIDYLIIDSAGVCCGGNPSEADVAHSVSNAIKSFPRVTTFLVGHNNKSGEDRWPLGSIAWHSNCRASWFVSAEKEGDGQFTLKLSNRKWNQRGNEVVNEVSYAFSQAASGVLTIEPTATLTPRDALKDRSNGEKLLEFLRDGPKSRDAINEYLAKDGDTNSVRQAIYRLKQKNRIIENDVTGVVTLVTIN
jgi:hypothetical protein